MGKMYAMGIELDNGERFPTVGTADEIIRRIDMQDCSNENIEVFDFADSGEMEKLTIHGPWHSEDPLYIKVTDKDGNIVFDGYGTDH